MNILRHLLWLPLVLLQAISAHAETAAGAGSSAAAPIYRSWAKAYSQAVGHAVEYESIGSSAGMKKIQQQAVGFGATDVYPSDKDLAEHGLLALPVAITGIAPVVNLPRMQGAPLRLTGEVLSRIFMGEITRWNAAEIAALNTDMTLPDLPIKVVVRADGSGTTYNFADYLGKVNPKWKAAYGARNSFAWPAGFLAFKGSEGVAKGVRETAGSIGYVDYGYVADYGLSAVQIKNADGVYIKPSMDAFRSALSNSDWAASGSFNTTLTQRPGKSSWPITMGTFVVFPKVARNPEQTAAALRFVIWSFLNGDSLVQENNFVRLPDRVQASAFRQITAVRDPQGRALGMGLLSSIHPPSP
ncbi:phosphate ABC transporter substrate-binding protein PstS [Acidovorax sp. BL-A-41-H1]|uniref:phosphate ABC transporter substrate-binding protein PstS n=1 Tax=Acidovorax sp. BL-A-41-H1 TaxID=3421102 RepID=UPI003F78B01C